MQNTPKKKKKSEKGFSGKKKIIQLFPSFFIYPASRFPFSESLRMSYRYGCCVNGGKRKSSKNHLYIYILVALHYTQNLFTTAFPHSLPFYIYFLSLFLIIHILIFLFFGFVWMERWKINAWLCVCMLVMKSLTYFANLSSLRRRYRDYTQWSHILFNNINSAHALIPFFFFYLICTNLIFSLSFFSFNFSSLILCHNKIHQKKFRFQSSSTLLFIRISLKILFLSSFFFLLSAIKCSRLRQYVSYNISHSFLKFKITIGGIKYTKYKMRNQSIIKRSISSLGIIIGKWNLYNFYITKQVEISFCLMGGEMISFIEKILADHQFITASMELSKYKNSLKTKIRIRKLK
ncbi:hypothetical protein VP01_800g2 [Puccinia sorghi]|uniref:Uncharacterized protein n=1 Tax=Puccinia sorghi TaxID=27349 RepID=A0A0L6UAG4_9BASI|nr:hypothetical protein VP01_800g2 [Puccinia sorghi]